jgi:hypothetical protein
MAAKVPAKKTPAKKATPMPTKPPVGLDKKLKAKYGTKSYNNGYTN